MARRKGFLATMAQVQREAERDRARRARLAARNQREAQRAATRAATQDRQHRQRLYLEDRVREAAEDTAAIDEEISALQNILAATLDVDDFLDLEELKRPPRYPEFDPLMAGPAPKPPNPGDFEVETPTGLARVFSAAKHAEKVARQHAEYQAATAAFHRAHQGYTEKLQNAHRRHQEAVAKMQHDHQEQVKEITALQKGLALKEPASVVRYLDLVLEAADYPDGFPHSWSLRYSPSSGQLDIDYQLPLIDVVPSVKSFKYSKTADSVSSTARPATQTRSLYAEILRQTALRVIHEVLEADRGGLVATAVLNGWVDTVDPATGRRTRRCLVAVATSRERFLQLDLGRVDTAACLEHLEARVSKDPSKLLPVDPIELSGSLDSSMVSTDDDDDLEEESPLLHGSAGEGSAPVRSEPPAQELRAGQNHPLDALEVALILRSAGTDLSAILVGPDGRVSSDNDFVFYNNPTSPCGAVSLGVSGASIDLGRVAPRHDRIVLVLSSGDGGPLSAPVEASCAVAGQTFVFAPLNCESVTAMVWGEFYRRDGRWRLRAIGQGWRDGLAGLARDFGVAVD